LSQREPADRIFGFLVPLMRDGALDVSVAASSAPADEPLPVPTAA
jgi:hypothetical protein